jgi:tRNA(fMet)-specific endonuclease VapC
MTGNKCLLDTSVVIHAFKKNNTVAERLDAIAEIYVPVTVIGELYYGAYKSSNSPKHITQIQSFLVNCKVLLPDAETADTYGQIKAVLIKKGKPLPENDIWIAAMARQYNLPLFTTDNHFTEIDNLTLVK